MIIFQIPKSNFKCNCGNIDDDFVLNIDTKKLTMKITCNWCGNEVYFDDGGIGS